MWNVCFIDAQTKPTRVCWGWNWTPIPRTEKRPTDLILSSAFRTSWKKRTAKLQAHHLIKHKVGRFNRFNIAFSISGHIKASFLPKDQNQYNCQDEKYWDGNQQGRHCAANVPSHLAYNHGTWLRSPVKQSHEYLMNSLKTCEVLVNTFKWTEKQGLRMQVHSHCNKPNECIYISLFNMSCEILSIQNAFETKLTLTE